MCVCVYNILFCCCDHRNHFFLFLFLNMLLKLMLLFHFTSLRSLLFLKLFQWFWRCWICMRIANVSYHYYTTNCLCLALYIFTPQQKEINKKHKFFFRCVRLGNIFFTLWILVMVIYFMCPRGKIPSDDFYSAHINSLSIYGIRTLTISVNFKTWCWC